MSVSSVGIASLRGLVFAYNHLELLAGEKLEGYALYQD
jgi:hypothetical protein